MERENSFLAAMRRTREKIAADPEAAAEIRAALDEYEREREMVCIHPADLARLRRVESAARELVATKERFDADGRCMECDLKPDAIDAHISAHDALRAALADVDAGGEG